ncbi:hypothetical protein HND97_07435 [Vibrio cholerae]|nr:hypothetical protein HND97_07435 [Vibrio cholerae]
MANEAKLSCLQPLGMYGENEGEWVVLDMGSVMLHVMQEAPRELYQLEKLWG